MKKKTIQKKIMGKKHTLSLFIFRRDLRINDNTALINALKNSKQVITCFIFDQQQISDKWDYIYSRRISCH